MSGTHGKGYHRLQRRQSGYFYRRRVPFDLVPVIGRGEIVRSLNTSRLAEAQTQAAMLDAAVYLLLDLVREGSVLGTEETLERLCARYRYDMISTDRHDRRRNPSDPEAEAAGFADAMVRESELLEARDFGHLRAEAQALLVQEGLELDGEAFEELLWELCRTRIGIFDELGDERTGDLVGRPRPPLTNGSTAALPKAKPSRMLSEVIALHIEDHEGGSWSERTAGMVKVELAEFLEIVGDRQIDQLTKDDIREYRRVLEKLTSRRSVRPEFRGKTIAEVLDLNPFQFSRLNESARVVAPALLSAEMLATQGREFDSVGLAVSDRAAQLSVGGDA